MSCVWWAVGGIWARFKSIRRPRRNERTSGSDPFGKRVQTSFFALVCKLTGGIGDLLSHSFQETVLTKKCWHLGLGIYLYAFARQSTGEKLAGNSQAARTKGSGANNKRARTILRQAEKIL